MHKIHLQLRNVCWIPHRSTLSAIQNPNTMMNSMENSVSGFVLCCINLNLIVQITFHRIACFNIDRFTFDLFVVSVMSIEDTIMIGTTDGSLFLLKWNGSLIKEFSISSSLELDTLFSNFSSSHAHHRQNHHHHRSPAPSHPPPASSIPSSEDLKNLNVSSQSPPRHPVVRSIVLQAQPNSTSSAPSTPRQSQLQRPLFICHFHHCITEDDYPRGPHHVIGLVLSNGAALVAIYDISLKVFRFVKMICARGACAIAFSLASDTIAVGRLRFRCCFLCLMVFWIF